VFQSLGATIVDVSLPMTKYAVATYYVLCPSEVSSNMARYDGIRFGHTVEKPENLIDYYERVRSEGFGAEVKRRIMVGTFALSAGYFDAYYRKAQQVRTLICKDFNDAFTKVDLILSPVAPNPALKIGEHAGDPVAMYLEDVFTIPQAMAGIPALSLPCGFSKDNLPIGLQLAGPQWSEELLLRAGYAFERETEWHTKKPAL
jgi:aspartyl-tRNA(Asn)/glutamyl-tRNA(Gln) amidotransferase subunit A